MEIFLTFVVVYIITVVIWMIINWYYYYIEENVIEYIPVLNTILLLMLGLITMYLNIVKIIKSNKFWNKNKNNKIK